MNTLVLNADCQPLSLLPLSVVPWQESLRLLYTDKASIVLSYEDKVIHSPSVTMNIPSVIMLKEYVKTRNKIKYNRESVYLRDGYTCQYCGLDALANNCKNILTLDHYIPRSRGGKSCFENMVTACLSCNLEKSDRFHMKPKTLPYKPNYFQMVKKRKLYPINLSDPRWNDYLMWDENLVNINMAKVEDSYILDI